uniref:T9SS type A sorting domain-containing protein n=1 Tax=Eiseniibacteriota bacterium TaxID=2212470 RepID=A0A832I2S1_UNCEI
MKRRFLPATGAAALAAVLAATAAFAEPRPTLTTTVDPSVVARVRAEDALQPWTPGRDCPPELMRAEAEAALVAPKGPTTLANGDNDGVHYARGSVLIINVFINHAGGTWDGTEMSTAFAKAANAADRYLSHAPANVNLHFSTEYFHAYINPTVGYTIATDGMTWTVTEDALAAWGFSDADGDGAICDDVSDHYHNWNGGWDEVILSFQPADRTGRAFASFGYGRCVNYTDDAFSVWWHEWGHLFGACDEYVESSHCNGGIDCGACQSTYLLATQNNDNCDLVSCPSDVTCVMRYNDDAVCPATLQHWAWVDGDTDGLADDVRRRESGATFRRVWSLYHNGWYSWNNTTDAQSLNQYWNHWMVAGLRSPADTDYDLRLYQEDNHNIQLAGSAYSGAAVDFVVGDYNHNRLGNEHLQISKFSGGSGTYTVTYEGGSEMLYPDGVQRAGNWYSYNVVRVWDVPLFAGEIVTFRLTTDTPGLDLGMALFKSNGAQYYAGRSAAVWSCDATGAGGFEQWTYTVPADDVYGLVLWSNSTVAGTFDIQIGPMPYTLAEETPFYSALDLRLFNYVPNAYYWAWVGTRPDAATDVSLRLFADAEYQTLLEESLLYGSESMEWIAVDYNHASFSQDYLRVVRVSGSGNHRTMWEGDAESLHGATGTATWTSPNLAKIWDVYMNAAQDYFFREYQGGTTFDPALYLYSSQSGDPYRPRHMFETFSNNPPSAGGEWLHYTPSATDWYGLAMPVFDESSDSYSLWFGPYYPMTSGDWVNTSNEVAWGTGAVPSSYWTVVSARASANGAADVWLYGDAAYTINTLAASDQSSTGVSYVIADYNHITPGYIYPRYRIRSGSSMTCQWEGGSNSLLFTAGGVNTYSLGWSANDVASAWDIYVPSGARLGILVEVVSGNLDLGVELFDSNAAVYYARKGQGVDFSDASGTGGPESVYWVNAGAADYVGLVIFNKNANSGTYRVRIADEATVSVDRPAPATLALAASPNPFLGATTFRYALPAAGDAELVLFDLQGRVVRTLVFGRVSAGEHEAHWDGTDDSGRPVAAGLYMARLRAAGDVRVLKIVRNR